MSEAHPGCHGNYYYQDVSSEVNTEVEATVEHQAHDTTECLLCGVQAEAEGIVKQYNTSKLHGSTLMDKINNWFALRIRKTNDHGSHVSTYEYYGSPSYDRHMESHVDWPWVSNTLVLGEVCTWFPLMKEMSSKRGCGVAYELLWQPNIWQANC